MDKKRKRTVLLRHFCKLATKVRSREVENIADDRERSGSGRKASTLPAPLNSVKQDEYSEDDPRPRSRHVEMHYRGEAGESRSTAASPGTLL